MSEAVPLLEDGSHSSQCQHPENFKFYCHDMECCCGVCVDCIVHHEGHLYSEVTRSGRIARHLLQQQVNNMKNKLHQLRAEKINKVKEKKSLEHLLGAHENGVRNDASSMHVIMEDDVTNVGEDLWICAENITILETEIDSTRHICDHIEDMLLMPAITDVEILDLATRLNITIDPSADFSELPPDEPLYNNGVVETVKQHPDVEATSEGPAISPRQVTPSAHESGRRSGVHMLQPHIVVNHPVEKTVEDVVNDDDQKNLNTQPAQSYIYDRIPETLSTTLDDDSHPPEPIDFSLLDDRVAIRDPTNNRVKVFQLDGSLLWTSDPVSFSWIRSITWCDEDSLLVCDAHADVKQLMPSGELKNVSQMFGTVRNPFLIHHARFTEGPGWILLIGEDNILHICDDCRYSLLSMFHFTTSSPLMPRQPLLDASRRLQDTAPVIINDVDVTDRKLWALHVTIDQQIIGSFGSHHYIHAVSLMGQSLWIYGSPGTPGRDENRLHCPWGMCNDTDGSLLLADSGNNRVIRLSSKGKYRGMVLGHKESLKGPRHLGIIGNSSLLVVDMDDEKTHLEKGNIKIYKKLTNTD